MKTTALPTLASLPEAVRDDLRKGIRDPVPVRLQPNLRLCRFTDRKYGPNAGLVSPWWITEADFNKIIAARERSRAAHGNDKAIGLSLGFMARWAVAIPQEWQNEGKPGAPTTMDLLLRGDLKVPVVAFVGRGRTQEETTANGITMKWTGWPDITQLYIPALSRKAIPLPTLTDVLNIMHVGYPTYIVSRPLYKRG